MEIPSEIVNEVAEIEKKRIADNTENVLILAMSVLFLDKVTASPTRYKYQDLEGKYTFYSGSQLVPGTKYIASLLDELDEQLDRIIIINTYETIEEAKTKDGKSFGLSACEYYKNTIKDFLLSERSMYEDEHAIQTSYDESALQNFFIEINKDEEGLKPDQYLWKVAQTIKSDESDKNVNLYVDTQGGDRNAIVEINAVIDLLRNRNVTVKKRIATDFNRENTIQYIKEVDTQYKTYELFSAMQSFERFGIGNELIDFFDSKQSELISTVQTLTESIQLCDMNTFDSAITKLLVLSQEKEALRDSRLEIVEKDIYGNYKDILENTQTGKRIILEEIRWCEKKGYLQQALTLIESKVLNEVYCSELLYWEPDKYVSDVNEVMWRDGKGRKEKPCNLDITQKEAIILAKKRWEDITTYSLVQWCQKCLLKMDYITSDDNNAMFLRDEDTKSAYISLKGISADIIPSELPDDSHNLLLMWNMNRKNNYEGKITYLFDKKNTELFKFLRLHMALKNQRNTINHASDDSTRRSSYDEIKSAIIVYLDLADHLFSGRSNKRSIVREREVYTFKPEKTTSTKKGFHGILLESNLQALLPKNKMKQAPSFDAMKKAIEDKTTYTVEIIGDSPIPGEVLVQESKK